jgi:hypothetical protein
MSKQKVTEVELSVEDAVLEAMALLEEIQGEIESMVDEASGTPRESTQFMQTMASNLDFLSHEQYPGDWEFPHGSLVVKVEQKLPKTAFGKTYLSRADRIDNICALLEAVYNKLTDIIADIEDEWSADEVDNAQEASDHLENIVSELQNCSWPSAR